VVHVAGGHKLCMGEAHGGPWEPLPVEMGVLEEAWRLAALVRVLRECPCCLSTRRDDCRCRGVAAAYCMFPAVIVAGVGEYQ
jgi:hypothetical protein